MANRLSSFPLFFFSLICSAQLVFAQPPTSTKSKKAEKLFWKAQEYRKSRDFPEAIALLDKAIEADENYVEAHHLIGSLLIIYNKKDEAAEHFKKAITLSPKTPQMIALYPLVAELALLKGDYEATQKYGKDFLAMKPNTARYKKQIGLVEQYLATCQYALEGIKNPVEFNPEPLNDDVNRFEQQYFPVLTADQQTLIYTARLNNRSDESMYQTEMTEGDWGVPTYISSINTHFNEGTCSISADGRVLIFTACDHINNPRQRMPGAWPVLGSCDLFMTKKVGDEWEKPQNLGDVVNSRYWESQPSLSADGRTLYFVSDRPGGVGGKDIWMSKVNADNRWSAPVNLGAPVNSAGDDISPFLHVNGTELFFASEGHIGYGGLDLFRTELKGQAFTKPENLGYPINTHADQVSLFITADGEKGYYSNEFRKDDQTMSSKINVFDIPEALKPKNKSDFVKGTIYDAKTKKKLAAQIDLVNLANGQVVSSIASDAKFGSYLIVLNKGAEYGLYVNKKGYLFQSRSFDYTNLDNLDSVTVDIYLDPIEAGSKITLNNIFFESGSYELLDKSQTELIKIVDFMSKNTEVKIEISGHTDDVGSDAANLTLSQNRANSVVKYLTERGIVKERLVAKGYGETQPILENSNDINRAKNRRIEFEIL